MGVDLHPRPPLRDQGFDADRPWAQILGRFGTPANGDSGGVRGHLTSADLGCKLGKAIAVETCKPMSSSSSFQGCITTLLAFDASTAVLAELVHGATTTGEKPIPHLFYRGKFFHER